MATIALDDPLRTGRAENVDPAPEALFALRLAEDPSFPNAGSR
jgi:hypothetical protein